MKTYVVKGEPLYRSPMYLGAAGFWYSNRRRARRFHDFASAKTLATEYRFYHARVMRLRRRGPPLGLEVAVNDR